MTEVKASRAQTELDIALKKKRVRLSEFKPDEFDSLLKDWVGPGLNLKHIRGFKPIGDIIRGLGREQYPIVSHEIAPECISDPRLATKDRPADGLGSYMIRLNRSWLSSVVVWKNFETGAITFDGEEAETWGGRAAITSTKESFLALRKAHWVDERLVHVLFETEKLPEVTDHRLVRVELTLIPLDEFRSYFGGRAAERAQWLLWEIRDKVSAAEQEIEKSLRSAREQTAKWENFASSIAK